MAKYVDIYSEVDWVQYFREPSLRQTPLMVSEHGQIQYILLSCDDIRVNPWGKKTLFPKLRWMWLLLPPFKRGEIRGDRDLSCTRLQASVLWRYGLTILDTSDDGLWRYC